MRGHPSAYIKSHPRGLKDGKSRVELDVVVTYPSKKRSDRERGEIVAFFTQKVREAGGTIVRKTMSP